MRDNEGAKGQEGQRLPSSPHARVKRSRDPLPLLPLAALAAPVLRAMIPGPPQPQQRARIARTPRGARLADQERSRTWKSAARLVLSVAARQAQRHDGWRMPDPRTPLEVTVRAVFACPQAEQRRALVGARWHAKASADADNVAKAVLDAANGVLWPDDRQVARLVVEKVIGAAGEAPRVELAVRVLEVAP